MYAQLVKQNDQNSHNLGCFFFHPGCSLCLSIGLDLSWHLVVPEDPLCTLLHSLWQRVRLHLPVLHTHLHTASIHSFKMWPLISLSLCNQTLYCTRCSCHVFVCTVATPHWAAWITLSGTSLSKWWTAGVSHIINLPTSWRKRKKNAAQGRDGV